MEQILADLFPKTEVPYPVILARMVGAILLGAVIGAEREYQDHPAGLRTHILVALSACVFSILSIESVHMAGFTDEQVRIDPLRVIEAVTSGVAFLAGAVGLSIGLGFWFVAAVATFACFVVLFILGKLQARVDEAGKADKISGKDDR
jgi:putative Mg2+ transporter-C (MgtC) family protein